MQRLDTCASEMSLDAVLLLGDQIYADATYGILDPTSLGDGYRTNYEATHKSLDRLHGLVALRDHQRLYNSPDDHEIKDNWEPGQDRSNQDIRDQALSAFEQHRLSALPPGSPASGYWGVVDLGGQHQVFMLDTRTMRDQRPWGPGSPPATPHIIHNLQRSELERWLLGLHQIDVEKDTVMPKLLSSAVWLLPRHAGRLNAQGGTDHTPARSDSWDGYPDSMHWLLTLIAHNGIQGVVVLCGDGHLAGHTVAQLTCDHHKVALHVLHAPALYAPFPFANARPSDYATHERFSWIWASNSVVCHVHSDLRPIGNGFVRVDLAQEAGTWQLTATFDTDAAPKPNDVRWSIGSN
jgi:phosphodiesterase/alkaline phosphatase D-like protein